MEDLAIRCSICTIGSCALQALGRDEVVRMEEHASHATFCRGEMLLRQDTPFHSIIYLRSGLVKEFMIHRNNRDQIIQVIKPRSYIGLQSFFTNTKSVFSYRAITPVEICYIEKETFSELISGNGYFAREIMTSMSMETLSNQQRILGLIQKQIFGKVAEMLLYFADQIFSSDTFELRLTRTEMAHMLASTRESVTKALLWFRKEKMISMQNNHYTLLDKQRIRDIASRG